MEQKLITLEIKFLHKKCHLWPSLCESNWKKWTLFGGSSFGRLKGKFVLQLSNETSENCRTGFTWCLTTSYQISSKNNERKKFMEDFAYMQIN